MIDDTDIPTVDPIAPEVIEDVPAPTPAEIAAEEKAQSEASLKALQDREPEKPSFVAPKDEPVVIDMKIGPTLRDELVKAGLGDLPVLVGTDRVQVPYDMADDVFARVKAVLDAHDADAGTMPTLRKQAFDTAMAYGNGLTAQVTRQYADVEVQSWTAQEIEARAIDAGAEVSATSLLAPLAEDKGVSVQAYAKSVIEKADQYRLIAVAGVKLRRGAEALLSEQLDTPDKLRAAVDALKTQARTYIDQFGLEA